MMSSDFKNNTISVEVVLYVYKAYISASAVTYFSWSPRKVPKEGDLRGHSEKTCPLKKPLRRISSRCSKMFRFLNTYSSKNCKFSLCRPPKIGTFSGVGWRCGGWILKEGAFSKRLLKPPSLVTFLAAKKVTLPHFRYLQKGIRFYHITWICVDITF